VEYIQESIVGKQEHT